MQKFLHLIVSNQVQKSVDQRVAAFFEMRGGEGEETGGDAKVPLCMRNYRPC